MRWVRSLLLSLVVIFSFTIVAHAEVSKVLLIKDSEHDTPLPRNFRSTSDTFPANAAINLTGLSDLHLLGSGQFSEPEFQNVLNQMSGKEIILIDLRQESHVLLNNIAVSWYGKQNADNAGKKPVQIERRQAQQMAALNKGHEVTIYDVLAKNDDGSIEETTKAVYPVEKILSEASLAGQHHIEYQRYYVQDHHAPTNTQVDQFVKLAANLSRNQWLYFHCHAGKGRTTTFMVMYDMMQNAKRVPLDDILARHAAMGGLDFYEMPDPSDFKYQPAIERLQFIKQFYQYALTNQDHFKTSWTEWLKGKK